MELTPWPYEKNKSKKSNQKISQQLHFSYLNEKIWYQQEFGTIQKSNHLKQKLKNILENGSMFNVQKNSGGKHPSIKGIMVLNHKAVNVILKKHKADRATNSYSEVGAYLVSEAYGFNMVPMTILRRFNNILYSVQVFIHGEHTILGKDIPRKERFLPPAVKLFDYMVAQWDRVPAQNDNPGNYIITWMKDPVQSTNDVIVMKTKYVLIDHSFALRSRDWLHTNFFYKKGIWHLNNKTVAEFADPSCRAQLEKYMATTRPELSEIDNYFDVKTFRANRFLRRRDILGNHMLRFNIP